VRAVIRDKRNALQRLRSGISGSVVIELTAYRGKAVRSVEGAQS